MISKLFDIYELENEYNDYSYEELIEEIWEFKQQIKYWKKKYKKIEDQHSLFVNESLKNSQEMMNNWLKVFASGNLTFIPNEELCSNSKS